MTSYILALHAGHNASVCIGDRSGVLYAIQEERLVREKNYWGFPRHAIQACLDYVGATPEDLAVIAYSGNIVLSRYHSRQDVIESYQRQTTVAGRLRQRYLMPLALSLKPDYGQSTLRDDLAELGLGAVPVVHYDHHRCHAASAYYGLREDPEEPYLVVTCDGAGDGRCATVGVWKGDAVEELASTPWSDSLGALYSWVTWRLGFVPLEHEYKLMGMAPYVANGASKEVRDLFRSYLWLDEHGLAFKRRTRQRINDLNERLTADLLGKRFDYVSAGLQAFTEDVLTAWVDNAVKASGVARVVAAGGVFMNVKANKRIAALPSVRSFEAFPSCGDESLPLGAFYLAAAERFGGASVPPLAHYYLGDAPSEEAMEEALRRSGFAYARPEHIEEAVADVLVAGHPLARCAGRMEFGARALGNRSILGDPKNEDLVRVINMMVKKRDFWMPFAPMIKADRQDRYLHNPKRLRNPYMMMTFDTQAETFRELIAAVHNADLTCRAQLLEPTHNPDMYAILDAFEARTGRSVLLNTSFNLHGYPIVHTAENALEVLKESGLEYLQLGPFLVSKRPPSR